MTCDWGVKQIGFEEGLYLKRTTRSSWRLESWAISRVSSSEASISVWERSEMAAMADVLRSISMAMDDCSSAAAAIWCDIWSMLLTESEIEARALLTFSISLTLRSTRFWQLSMLSPASRVA